MNTTTEQVLQRLRRSDDYVSSAELCSALDISRTAVWKHIRKLRQQGYVFDSVQSRGYRLLRTANLPSELELKPLLKTRCFGQNLTYLAATESTNAVAAVLAEQGAPEGTTVVADAQSAGRGRLQRRWHSPAGQNLYFSLILRPEIMPNQMPQFALAAGLSLCRSIRAGFAGLEPRAKWPNDVYLNGRKLAGILCTMVSEMERVRHMIVGIGVNVNITTFPADIADIATSLRLATGEEVSRPVLLADILADLESAYDQWRQSGLASFLDEWNAISYLCGRHVAVEGMNEHITGTVCGITETGALRVQQANGHVREIVGGEVHVI